MKDIELGVCHGVNVLKNHLQYEGTQTKNEGEKWWSRSVIVAVERRELGWRRGQHVFEIHQIIVDMEDQPNI